MSLSHFLDMQSIAQASQKVITTMPPVDVSGLNSQMAAQVQAILQVERFHAQHAAQVQFALVNEKVHNVSQQVGKVDRKIDAYASSATKEIAENKAALQALQQAQADMKSSVDQYRAELLVQAHRVSVESSPSSPSSTMVSILRKPENQVLRHLCALFLHLGLDTTCLSGMGPLMQFDYLKTWYPDIESSDPHEIVVLLPRCAGEMLKQLSRHFLKPIAGPISALERRCFSLDTLPPLTSSRDKLAAMRFPFYPYSNVNVTVLRLSTLIEMLQVEQAATSLGLPHVLNHEPFKPDTFQFHLASDECAVLLSKDKPTKGRKLSSFDPQHLHDQLKSVRQQPYRTSEAQWQFTARRRFATLEASSESLEHPPTRLAIKTILEQVFKRTDPLPEGPFHMGLNWKILPDRPVRSLAAILGEIFAVQSPAILEAFRRARSLTFPQRYTENVSLRQTRQIGSVKRSVRFEELEESEWTPSKKQKKRDK
jgi:hypothetical protein